MTQVKICGLRDPEMLQVAIESGARFVGFVFYKPSLRCVSPDIAHQLAQMVPAGVRCVGLFVNPDDAFLDDVLGRVSLDLIQLHGDENVDRVAEIKARTGLEVMKSVRVRGPEDLEIIPAYEAVCDWILLDAWSEAYGGGGDVFDWSLLEGAVFQKPWMLAGGLTAENVAGAVALLKPDALDVSSGVESSRGVKDAGKIRAFLGVVNAL